MSWGQSRETPSSCTDTDPEGRLQTPQPHCVQGRGGQAVLVAAAGRVPLRVLPGARLGGESRQVWSLECLLVSEAGRSGAQGRWQARAYVPVFVCVPVSVHACCSSARSPSLG